jgi:thiamine-phosphate pyrophosphorylase
LTLLPSPPLLVITDRRLAAGPLEEVIAGALRGGCRWLSLREKDMAHEERVALLNSLVGFARPFGARVTVNGDVAAARAAGAGGVHLPAGTSPAAARRALGAGALIGVSAHTIAEAASAARAGADYVTLSPIFPSATKPGYGPPLGRAGLAEAARALTVPVVALGGVTAANAADCLAAGAEGVAVLGAVMAAADPEAATARLVAALSGAR